MSSGDLKNKNLFKSILKFFASMKLAVFILVSLAALIAVGTIIESKYNAEIAKKLIYDTWMMTFVMSLLATTLTAVMVDRWPWKKRHVPFILAHIGILVIQLGFVLSSRFGLDGSMRFGIGESNRYVTTNETELQIWSSFDGERFTKLMDRVVDFYKNPPGKDSISFDLPEQQKLSIVDYKPFVIPRRDVVGSEETQRGSALRFMVKNDRVNVIEWLVQARKDKIAEHNMGPAQFYLGPLPVNDISQLPLKNAIYFQPKDHDSVDYVLTYKDPQKKPLRGTLKEGQNFETGWMGLVFSVLMLS